MVKVIDPRVHLQHLDVYLIKKIIYKSCVQYLSLITYYAMQLFSIEKDAACSIGKVQNKVHFIEVKIILKKGNIVDGLLTCFIKSSL